MKNIQRAMVVLLSHSLCVQAQVTMQQTLDTVDAWHIRNIMGENPGKNYTKIILDHEIELKSIHNRFLADNAFQKDNIDSLEFRVFESKLPEQYMSILTGLGIEIWIKKKI